MKKNFLAVTLSVIMSICTFGTTSIANAENSTDNSKVSSIYNSNDIYLGMREYISNSIMFSDNIEALENKYNFKFDFKPQDLTQETIKVNSEWVKNAKMFLETLYNEDGSQEIKTNSNNPNNKQSAKADAIMYSIDRASISTKREPYLDFEKETQYMFISHYIDRYEYYWSSEDERLLLDGESMSGENGYLADWLTSSDRRSYDAYMTYLDLNKAMKHLGNIGVEILFFDGRIEDISTGIEAIKDSNKMITVASGLVLQDSKKSISDVFKEDIKPTIDKTVQTITQNPTEELSEIYDRFMRDEGLMGAYSPFDKESIVRTSLSILGSFIIGGPLGAATATLSTLTRESLRFTIDTYNDFFNYTAWVALRYGFSGRYANRTWYYLTGDPS